MIRTNICTCGHGAAHHDQRYLKCRCSTSYGKICSCQTLELSWYIKNGKRFDKHGEI